METVKIKEVLSESWRKYKPQVFPLAGITILYFIISMTLGLFYPIPGLEEHVSVFLMKYIGVSLISIFISIVYFIGMIRTSFDVLEDEEVSLKYFLPNVKTVFNVFVTNLFILIIVILGLLLLVIPGIFLGIRLWYAPIAVIKDNKGIVESFKYSWKITEGRFFKLFLFFLSVLGILLLGFLCLIVGIFFVYPWILLAICLLYNRLVRIGLKETDLVETI